MFTVQLFTKWYAESQYSSKIYLKWGIKKDAGNQSSEKSLP